MSDVCASLQNLRVSSPPSSHPSPSLTIVEYVRVRHAKTGTRFSVDQVTPDWTFLHHCRRLLASPLTPTPTLQRLINRSPTTTTTGSSRSSSSSSAGGVVGVGAIDLEIGGAEKWNQTENSGIFSMTFHRSSTSGGEDDEEAEARIFVRNARSFEFVFGWLFPGIKPTRYWNILFLLFFPRLLIAIFTTIKLRSPLVAFFLTSLVLLSILLFQVTFSVFILSTDSLLNAFCMAHLLLAMTLSLIDRSSHSADAATILSGVLFIGNFFYATKIYHSFLVPMRRKVKTWRANWGKDIPVAQSSEKTAVPESRKSEPAKTVELVQTGARKREMSEVEKRNRDDSLWMFEYDSEDEEMANEHKRESAPPPSDP
eukprot:TRINITY_DN2933_c0_g3_i2.p1 TRINITY_DN2933_c0_g3~~TRINITY_DN2933_c0_g3_i2.p1  ORF type:complete len:376 (+),score=97.61 TRINITY_DN2933_c0_g3_i2:24-1130(+)